MGDETRVDYKPGDEFWLEVTWPEIGIKRYKTIIDEHGTQRFEKKSEVQTAIDVTNGEILNDNARAYQNGKLSLIDLLEFDMATGYSVGGWEDVLWSVLGLWRNPNPAGPERVVVISNPLYNDGEPEVWSDREDDDEEDEARDEARDEDSEQAEPVDFKPGDEFWIEVTWPEVGTKRYKTIIDEHSTQRFEKVPEIDAAWKANPHLSNTRAIDYQEGRLSLVDFFEWEMGIGYSVGGLEDTLGSLLDMWNNPTDGERVIVISNPLHGGEPEVWRG